MSFDDISAVDLGGSDGAVIWSLRGWVTVLGPSVWPTIRAQESVFLLEPEPGLMLGIRAHQSYGFGTIVEFVGASVGIPGVAHDQDIVAASERIGENRLGPNEDIGVLASSLAGRGAIKVPFWQFVGFLDRLLQGLYEC